MKLDICKDTDVLFLFTSLTLSPSRYGSENDFERYSATVVFPHPAGPVTIQMCLCSGAGAPFDTLLVDGGAAIDSATGSGDGAEIGSGIVCVFSNESILKKPSSVGI